MSLTFWSQQMMAIQYKVLHTYSSLILKRYLKVPKCNANQYNI